MNDTPPEVERGYRELLLQRSGVDRLRMGCSMHATAQALVRASVLERDPQASPATLRRALFLRFYGQDFDAETRERILLALDRSAGASGPAPIPTADNSSQQQEPFATSC